MTSFFWARFYNVRFAIAVGGIIVSLMLPRASFAAQVQVSITNSDFSPQQMYVNVGDSVVWTNTDTVAHTVMSDTGMFDSTTLQAGQSFSHTFSMMGTFGYYDQNNGGPNGVGMSGTIIVNGCSSRNRPMLMPMWEICSNRCRRWRIRSVSCSNATVPQCPGEGMHRVAPVRGQQQIAPASHARSSREVAVTTLRYFRNFSRKTRRLIRGLGPAITGGADGKGRAAVAGEK